MSKHLPMEVYSHVYSGEVSGSAAIKQLPDVDCRMVMFSAPITNANPIWLGGSTVTLADGTTDITSGFELVAGASTPLIPVVNVNKFYVRCTTATDDILYFAVG